MLRYVDTYKRDCAISAALEKAGFARSGSLSDWRHTQHGFITVRNRCYHGEAYWTMHSPNEWVCILGAQDVETVLALLVSG